MTDRVNGKTVGQRLEKLESDVKGLRDTLTAFINKYNVNLLEQREFNQVMANNVDLLGEKTGLLKASKKKGVIVEP